MCGLAGLFILPDSQPPLPDFNLALAAMKHRGPDDEGFLHFNWVLFLLNQKKYSYLLFKNYVILANGRKRIGV
jgi:asparagine synthetase B (glutamine-hydrolysing)